MSVSFIERASALRARLQTIQARGLRRTAALLLLAAASVVAPAALATVTVNKQFTPATVDPGDLSRFRISFFNSSLVPLTAAAVTDNLPAQVSISNPPNVVDTCGFGAITATSGTQRVIASAGTIPAGSGLSDGSCYIEMDVTSTQSGNWVNTIPANGPSNGFVPGGTTSGFQATEGAATVTNTTPASATLSVRFLAVPTGSKTFSPSPALVGEPTTLTITLTNPNTLSTIPLTTFTDSLPAGMTVAAVPAPTIACTGTNAVNGTVTANAGDTSVTLTGGTIGVNGTCTMTVKVVVATIAGATQSLTNTVPANAIGNTRGLTSASFNRALTVNSPIAVTKSYVTTSAGSTAIANPIPLNTEFWLRIDIGNSSTTTPLVLTSFTDTLPAGLAVGSSAGLATIDCTTNGGGTSGTFSPALNAGDTAFTVAGGTVGILTGTRRCRINVPVVQTIAGSLTNNIPAGAVGNSLGVTSPAASASSVGNGQLTVSKSAAPASVAPGQPTTFTITINNYSGGAVTGVNFTDTLPTIAGGFQMVLANPVTATQNAGCTGGAFTGNPGDSAISWNGGTIVGGTALAPGVCIITFKAVAPLGATIGQTFTNSIPTGTITGTGPGGGGVGNTNSGSAGVLMVAAASVAKSFSPASVVQGGVSQLTVTITNASGAPLTNAGITDTFPANLAVAATPATSTTCTGGTVTALPGATAVSLSGATIPTAGCNFKVNVVASGSAGTRINTIAAGALSNDQSATNPSLASATLTVTSGLTATKTFTPASVASGGVSQVLLRVTNPSTSPFTNLSLTDGPMTNMVVANPASASTTCAGSPVITATPGSNTVTMTGATLAAGANCDVLFNIQTSGNPANWPNTLPIGAITTAEGAQNTAAVTATLGKVTAFAISINKSFLPVSVSAGQPSTLQIDVVNPVGSPTAVHNVTFTDTFPAGMEVYPTPGISTTCSNATITAVPGANSVKMTGATINVGSTCSVFVQVTSTKFLNLTNTIPANAVTSTEGLTNTLPTSATLSTLQGLGITKSFTPTSVSQGQTSQLAIRLISTLDPGAQAPLTLTNVSFSDTLPATITVAPTPNASTTCTNGNVAATPASGVVTVTGVTLPPGASCFVYVDVLTSALGAFTNDIPIGAVTSNEGYSNQVAADAVLNVLPPPTVTKSFSPASVAPGVNSRATIVIHNNSAAVTLHNVSYLDTLPGGLAVAPVPNASVVCGAGAAVAATASGTTITLTNGTIAPGADCTVQVDVRSNTPGSYINTIPAGGITTAEGITNPTDASGTLAVLGPPNVVKSFTPASINTNDISRLSIQLGNPNPAAATLTANFTDNLPANVVIAAAPNLGGTCTLASVTAAGGGTAVTYANGASIPSGGCTIDVDVTSAVANSYTNTIPANALQTSVGNNGSAATAGLVVIASADLAIVKSNGVTSVTAGTPTTYTITVTNNGPSPATGAILTDLAATGLTKTAVACSATPGQCVTPPSIAQLEGGTFALPLLTVGATYQITVTAMVDAVSGTVSNTATVQPPAGTTDPNPGNNSSTDTDDVVASADLAVTKIVDNATPNVGANVTFTMVVTNLGPSAAANVQATDLLPAGYTLVSATPSIGSYDPVTGIWSAIGTLNSGASAQLVLTATVLASGSYLNTVTVTSTTNDPNPNNNTASAGTTPVAQADVAITKIVSNATPNVGSNVTFTIVVSNNGPSAAANVQVTDLLPAGYTYVSSVPAIGSYNSATGLWSGIGTLVNGASAQITITATVLAAGPYLNTAIATSSTPDPNPGNNSASIGTTPVPQADLAIVKTVNTGSPNVGSNVTFTLVVTNNGPSAAANVQVNDLLPAGYAYVSSVPSIGTYNGVSGVWSAIGTLANGATAQLTITATVNAAGPYVNTATVSSTTNDPNPSNNTSSVGTLPVPVSSLAVSKTDNSATYTPGGTGTYVIVVTNGGPSAASSVTVSDSLPAGVTLNGTVTCAVAGTATCGSVTGVAGQTSFGATGATIAAGAGNSLTFTVPVKYASSLRTDPLVNTVNVTDPASTPASASDSSGRAPSVTLAVAKTDGSATYTPGGTATYVVTVTNTGPSDANSVSVVDTLPAGVTLTANVTCTANGVANCGTVTGSNGQLAFGTTGATLGAGTGDSLVFTVPVAFAPGMTTNPLVNTATATDPAATLPASGSDSNTLAAQVSLAVVKTDGSNTYTPGGTATYTVTVTNGGLSTANVVTVTDPLPAGVTLTGTVTCVASGLSNCGTVTGTSGQGSFGTTGAVVVPGAGNALTFTVPVAFAAGMSVDPLVNTATATDGPTGATGSGSDSNARAARVTLAVVKTDNATTYTPGGTGTYVVTVTNTGTSDALNVTVNDPLPAGVTLTGAATCAASGIATCGTVTGSTGQATYGVTGAGIGAGVGNAIVISAPVAFAATLTDDPLVNTATATDLASGATGSGSDSDARNPVLGLAVTKTDGSATYTPGGTATYTIVVTNAGPTNAGSLTVIDPLPTGVTINGGVLCAAAGNATCGLVTGAFGQTSFGTTQATLAAGAGNSLTFTVPVAFAAGLSVDPLVNTVTVNERGLPPVSASDSNTLSAKVSLTVVKYDGVTTYTPGGFGTYTVKVANTGVSDALDVTVSDPLPAGVTLTAAATCVATGNAGCGTVTGAVGGTSFGATGAHIGTGADLLTFTAPVAFAASMTTDPLVNTVTVTDLPSGASGSASDSNRRNGGGTAPTLTKSIAPSSIVAGGTATLTLALGNGNATAATLTVAFTDAMPNGVTTTSGNAGTCTNVSVTATLITMPAGSVLPAGGCTIVVTITSTTPGTVVNTTSPLVTGDGTAPAASAPLTVTLVPPPPSTADLAVTKTNNVSSVAPGDLVTYVIVATNLGPDAVTGATVKDTLPATLTGVTWTCVASAGSSCPASGSGNLNVLVNLLKGGTATFTVKGTLSPSATGTLVNTVTIGVPPGTTDPNPGNNTATDSDPIVPPPPGEIHLAIAKTHVGTFTPGQIGAQYHITITNTGSSPSVGLVTVTDTLPAGLTATSIGGAGWTCAQPLGPCTRSDSLAPGASWPDIVLTVNVSPNPPATIVNVVSFTGGGDKGGNNTAQNTVTFPQPPLPPDLTPIPVDAPVALLLLAVALAIVGAGEARRRRM
jgi:uncharacterized repeat protein (TIGR01451 family)